MKQLPNILTIGRIAIIPLVIFAMMQNLNLLALVLFVIASITDFLDGYLARKLKVESKLGTMLDPIADKLLVASVLVMLVNSNTLVPIMIILLREILVSGIREFLATQNISMPVTKLAKWKTTLQLMAIIFLLYQINEFSIILLWLSALITAITGWQYTKYAIKRIY